MWHWYFFGENDNENDNTNDHNDNDAPPDSDDHRHLGILLLRPLHHSLQFFLFSPRRCLHHSLQWVFFLFLPQKNISFTNSFRPKTLASLLIWHCTVNLKKIIWHHWLPRNSQRKTLQGINCPHHCSRRPLLHQDCQAGPHPPLQAPRQGCVDLGHHWNRKELDVDG